MNGFGPHIESYCLKHGLSGLVVDVSGGDFPEDVSWSLTFPSGDVKTGEAGDWSGSCTSPFPTLQPSVTSLPTEGCDLYTIELYDSYGDGWNFNTLTISSCAGVVLANDIGGNFLDGHVEANVTLCLEVGLDGLIVDVGGGEFPDDVSWNITLPSGIKETGVAGSTTIGSCLNSSSQSTPEPSMPSPVPMPAPTDSPVFEPTQPRTNRPTALDNVKLEGYISISATAAPTDSDEAALKAMILNQTRLDEVAVTAFTVEYALATRLRRLLSTYSWEVTFEVQVSLMEMGTADADALKTELKDRLLDASFVSNVISAISAVVSLDEVYFILATRSPTNGPTLASVSSPSNSSAASAASAGVLVAVVVVLLVLCCAGAVCFVKRRAIDSKDDSLDAPIDVAEFERRMPNPLKACPSPGSEANSAIDKMTNLAFRSRALSMDRQGVSKAPTDVREVSL